VYLKCFRDLDLVDGYSRGAAALAHLYRGSSTMLHIGTAVRWHDT